MSVQSLSPVATAAGSSGAFARVGSDQFMTLLIAQLRNQSPLAPVSDTEFLGQLAQFSSLEQAQQQTASLQDLIALTQATTSLNGLGQASNLIGKEVSWLDPETGSEATGTVERVVFGNGQILLDLGGPLVSLGQITGITGSSSGLAGGGGAPIDPGSGGGSGTGGGTGSDPGAGGTGTGAIPDLFRLLSRRGAGGLSTRPLHPGL